MKRIARGPVRGISFKLQEEERERKDQYVPDISALDYAASDGATLEVDPDTKDLLKILGVCFYYFSDLDLRSILNLFLISSSTASRSPSSLFLNNSLRTIGGLVAGTDPRGEIKSKKKNGRGNI